MIADMQREHRAPTQRPACAVAGGAEALVHASLSAHQHVGARAHRAANQHGLTDELHIDPVQ